MYTLLTNVPFTKRKTLHHIMDDDGDVLWSGPNIGNAMEYLLEKGQNHFTVTTYPGMRRWTVQMASLPTVPPEP